MDAKNRKKIAFLFAGQGSQYVGMGKDLDIFKAACEVKDAVMKKRPDIFGIMTEGPAEELNKTINTQLAVFAHDFMAAAVLRDSGIVPDYVAGFSLGEIPALCFAEAFDLAQGVEIVNARAKAMQECCDKNGGAMVAVLKLSAEKTKQICNEFRKKQPNADITPVPVNFNSPEQTVCACSAANVDSFIAKITENGGRAIKLKVSGAFHCAYMEQASLSLAKYLNGVNIKQSKIPVYSNFTGLPYSGDYKNLICNQVKSPVLWQQIIENILRNGVSIFIEVGPGNVLSGLVKKIAEANAVAEIKILNASDVASIENIIKEMVL